MISLLFKNGFIMKPVSPNVSLPEVEKRVLSFWQENQTFKKSIDNRKGSPEYLFYDGPPFSSGLPHYGNLVAGTIKDIVPRYQTMKGCFVERRFGWDTHGLPIEMIIERELGLKGRTDILEYGVDRFNEACRAGVLSCVKEWEIVTTKLGRWVDFDNDYKTMDIDFMESVWWVFKQLWDRGRIYEGARVMPYSWRLSTPLSNFEAGLNYKEVQDPAITIRFRLIDMPGVSALAWTTTPWTLPSNLALCVGPDIQYCQIATANGEKLLLAKARLSAFFKKDADYKVEAEFSGKDLIGQRYQPLFPYYQDLSSEGAFKFIADSYVTTEDGTGIVHQSPAHGEDDYRICKAHGLPLVDPVDVEGNFTEIVKEFAGQNIKEADRGIIQALKDKGLLFKHDTVTHSYPFCERSETPLIYKAISAWYVKVEDLRSELLENNNSITWVPEHIKHGRFGKWLEQAVDWNISRNRFWGNPIPVWRCEKCNNDECIGSRAELEGKTNQAVADLHKHFVDELHWKCSKCGGTMTRIPEVLDCWFESGSMPYAQLHYPFENKERFQKVFPADFIAEGIDQTRGWFYTLMVLGTTIFKKAPFKNCVVNGIVLAEDGRKMSKRLKNYPDPLGLINAYGADALRLALMSSPVVKGENLRFTENGVKEIVRSVLLPYWNVYSFFTTYATVDGFAPDKNLTASTNILDRWVLSRFQSLLKNIEREMDGYRLFTVVPILLEFLEELTNWYIRRSRRRFWSDDTADKQAGYNTTYYILLRLSQALAPFLPFITEEIYQNLATLSSGLPESVHLTEYPLAEQDLIDQELECDMALIKQVVKLGRVLRSRLDIRIRQPLPSITVVSTYDNQTEKLKALEGHIQEELNVKQVLFSAHEEDLVNLSVKPNYPVCGPKVGKRMGELAKALATVPPATIQQIEAGKSITLLDFELDPSDLQVIRQPKSPDLQIETASGVTVLFDTKISAELKAEGVAREFINRVQKMRKDADFHVSDRIEIQYMATAAIKAAVSGFSEYIENETLATRINHTENQPNSGDIIQPHEIDGEKIVIALTKRTAQ